jgi:hypothetical protein
MGLKDRLLLRGERGGIVVWPVGAGGVILMLNVAVMVRPVGPRRVRATMTLFVCLQSQGFANKHWPGIFQVQVQLPVLTVTNRICPWREFAMTG